MKVSAVIFIWKKTFLAPFIFILFCFSSCQFFLEGDSVIIPEKKVEEIQPEPEEPEMPEPELTEIQVVPVSDIKSKERKWTILVYMSADNSLEASALMDLDEMEKSGIDTDEVTVLVLVDRSPSYDASNDNWYKTKLLKLKSGKQSSSEDLWSEEIDCESLGLIRGKDIELDMSSYVNLSKSIDFIYNNYPADHYGLIVWGSGEGWRGFCYDGTSGTNMNLYQLQNGLKNGLNGKKLDFIGFDSCFGAELEVLYQLRDYGEYAVGVEGLLGINGWNYSKIFNQFSINENKTAIDLCDAIVNQFSKDYELNTGASVCSIKLSEMENYFSSFDSFCKKTGDLITSAALRDEVKDCIVGKVTQFVYEQENNDLQIDIHSLVEQISETKIGNKDLLALKEQFFEAEKNAVMSHWYSEGGDTGLGVYFSTLTVGNLFSSRHPAAYTKGKTANQIDFVKDSVGYVPGAEGSLLEKIFYTIWE